MSHFHKIARILVPLLVTVVILVPSAGNVAWAGPVEEAGRSLGEYIALAPGDTDGIEQFRAAINCFALAWEIRRWELTLIYGGAGDDDWETFMGKCRFERFGDVVISDADGALRKGLINLTGGLISALAEILKKH